MKHADLRLGMPLDVRFAAGLDAYPTRSLEALEAIVLHRAGWAGLRLTAQEVRGRLRAHWPRQRDSYHYLVDWWGRVTQALPLGAVSYHAADLVLPQWRRANTRTLPIAVLGDGRVEAPSEAQHHAVLELVHRLRLELVLPLHAKGHDDLRWRPKPCPGRFVRPLIDDCNR